MSDNTPFSGSAGPHSGKKRGFSAWITGAEQSAAIKTNLGSLTKAGQAFKKNILQHKGEDTAGCSVGVRELGDDGFTRYNIEGEAIFITKRSTDVFSDDEFVDAGSEQFIGRRLGSAEEPKAEAAHAAKPSTFVPDIGRKPAPKTFKGIGYREAPAKTPFKEVPAKEVPVKQAPAEVAVKPAPKREAASAAPVEESKREVVLPSNSAAIMGKVAKRVPRIESPIDWSDPDDSEDMFISQSESSVPEAAAEPEAVYVEGTAADEETVTQDPVDTIDAPVVEQPVVADEPDEGTRTCEGFIEQSAPLADIEALSVEEAPAEAPVVATEEEEAPVIEDSPVVDVPGIPAEIQTEASAVPVTAVPAVEGIEAEPIGDINGLYIEGDAKSNFSESTVPVADNVVTANTSSAAVEAPKDLTAYGINGVTDPQVARPRPRYRTYKISGGRICDSASVEGRKEEPQRPLD